MDDGLELFSPLVASWFRDTVGAPTEVQRRVWPRIADGAHVLATAPTGSGKTLAAFLWAVDRLLTGQWEAGTVRVLYVSPLKALNNDVQRNLLGPLAQIRQRAQDAGQPMEDIGVMTRSGETPDWERRRMLRSPPEILITTPESLNLLITARGSRSILTGVRTIILDEIHAVASSKRGVHLLTAVERLTRIAGELQRVALSATVEPVGEVARLVGGWRLQGGGGFERRQVETVVASDAKTYRIDLVPPSADDGVAGVDWWRAVAAEVGARIESARSSLVFTNSRRMAERLTRFLNENRDAPIAWAHHGSLSREIRLAVEERLKRGELESIVATSSLELGIDVGALDQVLLVGAPPSVSATLQRLGRAGHQVGAPSVGCCIAINPRDLVDGFAVVQAVLNREIEPVAPPRGALDVLAQVILAMTATERWQLDELYDVVRTADSYHDLPRDQFDLVVEMLAGRYADTRIRELTPRVVVDRIDSTIEGRPGTLRLVAQDGGTIPDRGYYDLRTNEGNRLGELDEEFVWERSVGDVFTFGTQSWRVERISHAEVAVAPTSAPVTVLPFWRAEALDRSGHLSERIGTMLETLETALCAPGDQDAAAVLSVQGVGDPPARALVDLLARQRSATRAPLPHRHHLVIERCADAVQARGTEQLIVHTLWGGRCNRPLAMALAAAWRELVGDDQPIEIMADNDCLLLVVPEGADGEALLRSVTRSNLDRLLARELEHSGLFGARFRESAQRALLLPRRSRSGRMPLWLSRRRSRALLETVARFGDFPIVLETWRECLQDAFELETLRRRLDELEVGEIGVSVVSTRTPSPFAQSVTWARTNTAMYEDDTPAGRGGAGSALREDLVRQVAESAQLRPAVPPEIVARFEGRAQRTAPGYAPRDAAELVAWAVERALLVAEEWSRLLDAVARDAGGDRAEWLGAVSGRLAVVRLPETIDELVVALEALPRLAHALGVATEKLNPVRLDGGSVPYDRLPAPPRDTAEETADALVAEWLAGWGPVTLAWVSEQLGALARPAMARLVDSGQVIVDRLVADATADQVCDRSNLEVLLRMQRTASRPELEPRPVEELGLLLALHQGVAAPGHDIDALQDRLGRLFGFPAQAHWWEELILPARMEPYIPAWLDSVLQAEPLLWLGCGERKLTFALSGELDLYRTPEGCSSGKGGSSATVEIELPERGRLSFEEIVAGRPSSAAVAEALWQKAWQGEVSCDSFHAVRQGIATGFQPKKPEREPSLRGRRRRFASWRSSRPFTGSWYRLAPPAQLDPLEADEVSRERVRQLLDRYPVLFRELLARELPPLQMHSVFRALRLMELAGEVVAGQFFRGVPGPQFASHQAARQLGDGLDADRVYWLSAVDPASLCGLGLDGLEDLPARRPTTFLAYHGPRLVVVAERSGRRLEIRSDHEHPMLGRYLGFLRVLVSREQRPASRVVVETINGVPALASPYQQRLRELGFERSTQGLVLVRR